MTQSSRSGRAPSQRQLRVGEEIRHVLAQVFERGEVHEPVLTDPPISVTEVRISPDLRNATAFVMRLGGGDMREVLRALRITRPYLRKRIGERLRLRVVPDLSFEEDHSFDEASQIDAILRSPHVARDLGAAAARADDADADMPDVLDAPDAPRDPETGDGSR
ncbi:30S ribosome-binding factor RbfA [Phaeovibrio sulfidiphilus]|uniref:Ribosome-binding factor A n=1 Tax=Phaeovibrio sulfidiphilus TaxID=1220600 RepID=A0A8J7CCY8_9PROT|nr:30S ribosome-binding factor RbfA [Phaeovibrio sulfidiphilus]MBE1236379.1 30S ribosome-binding factor RbfA [Phaeovibrio sulfidiphilus]